MTSTGSVAVATPGAKKVVPVVLDKKSVVMVGRVINRTLHAPGIRQAAARDKRFSLEEATRICKQMRQISRQQTAENARAKKP